MNISPWPSYSAEEAEIASNILLSNKVNYWTGNECREFESEFAKQMDSKYAVALCNGTVTLEVSLMALGIGAGDEVIVTPRSFLASASCVHTVGATPVFADVDSISQNMTAETIERSITENTKAIIIVHLSGFPADMESIMELANAKNLKVIEDCAQAHGAKIGNKSVGSFGHVGSWSFCQDKIMTTAGEGGMITTDDKDLWKFIWSYKDHGKNWDSVYNKDHPEGYRWIHDSFGTNYRMTEIQGAIGRYQLTKLESWTNARTKNALKLCNAAKQVPIFMVPEVGEDSVHAWYKWNAFINTELLSPDWNRDRIVSEMRSRGVPCLQGTCPELYMEGAFRSLEAFKNPERFPVAKLLGETSIMLPIHPTLTSHEIDLFCEVITEVGSLASR